MSEKKNGVIQEYFGKGKINLWKKFFIFNGKIEGEYKKYWEDGQLWITYNYKNGKLEGECITYYQNEKRKICNYKNNYKNNKLKK